MRPPLKWSLVINGIKCKKLALCSDQKMTRPETEFWNLFTTANRMAAKIVHITLTFDWGGSCILLLNAASVEECLYFYFYFYFLFSFPFSFLSTDKERSPHMLLFMQEILCRHSGLQGGGFWWKGRGAWWVNSYDMRPEAEIPECTENKIKQKRSTHPHDPFK